MFKIKCENYKQRSSNTLSSLHPSRPDPGRRKKINLKYLFSHFFVMPQGAFKAFIKPFEAP